jgi:DNA primase
MSTVLEEVLARTNILDVVSQYVKLRKAGKDYTGLCPFHKEKTPSFTVSTEKQIYYCFGCHEGGNVVHFLSKYEHSTFHEALETLAKEAGVDTHNKISARRTPVFDAMQRLADYYHQNLKRTSFALKYLRDRQIDDETMEKFKLGFSERRTYTQDFAKRLGAPLDMLFSTGIMKMKDGGEIYDIFRGRVMVPIFDVNGRVIGFGGRGLGKDVIPKYINSPESPIFSKRSVLFGLDKARKEIADKNEAIIVEGYFDLIALHAGGVRNAVATLGTSITEEQVSRLRNYTENITLMLDGDEAGIKSALRIVTLFGEMGINGQMVVLPDNHDPDSLMRQKGIDGFNEAMGQKKPLLDYFFDFHKKRFDVTSIEGKLGFIKLIMPYVDGMSDAVKRRVYVQRLSELTGVEEFRFWDAVKSRRREETVVEKSRSGIEEKVVGILINKPEFIQKIEGKGVESRIADGDLKELLVAILDHYAKNGPLDVKLLLNVLEKQELRERAVGASMDVAGYDEPEMEKILVDYLFHIESKLIMEEAKGITVRLAEAEKRGDEKALQELLERKKHVLAAMKFKSAK